VNHPLLRHETTRRASELLNVFQDLPGARATGANFVRMLLKFNSVYNPKLQIADHQQPVKYEISPPPKWEERIARGALYVHAPGGRKGRPIDTATEQFVEATRMGAEVQNKISILVLRSSDNRFRVRVRGFEGEFDFGNDAERGVAISLTLLSRTIVQSFSFLKSNSNSNSNSNSESVCRGRESGQTGYEH
jgi:hypothetical protein